MRKLIFSLLVLILCGAPSAAQTTSTEVLGTVSDSTGAVVPAAKITLLRIQTGERRTSESDSSGNFSFPLIEIGDYTVSVEMAGFKTQTQTGVHVEYQQKARVNVTLDVGAASERVDNRHEANHGGIAGTGGRCGHGGVHQRGAEEDRATGRTRTRGRTRGSRT